MRPTTRLKGSDTKRLGDSTSKKSPICRGCPIYSCRAACSGRELIWICNSHSVLWLFYKKMLRGLTRDVPMIKLGVTRADRGVWGLTRGGLASPMSSELILNQCVKTKRPLFPRRHTRQKSGRRQFRERKLYFVEQGLQLSHFRKDGSFGQYLAVMGAPLDGQEWGQSEQERMTSACSR